MILRHALEQTRALRSESLANESLWDAHQRTLGHPSLTPSWQRPAPARRYAKRIDKRHLLQVLVQGALNTLGALALAAAVFVPMALHLG
jgi:hypothetical protein